MIEDKAFYGEAMLDGLRALAKARSLKGGKGRLKKADYLPAADFLRQGAELSF